MSQGTQGAQTLRRSASFTLALAGSSSSSGGGGGAAGVQPSPAASQAFQQQLRVYQETVCSSLPISPLAPLHSKPHPTVSPPGSVL